MRNLQWQKREEELLAIMNKTNRSSMLMGYGVNVKFNDNIKVDPAITVDSFTRLATFIDQTEAYSFYDSLVTKIDNALIFDKIELEEIWLSYNGYYEYEQIKLTHVGKIFKKQVKNISTDIEQFEQQMKAKYPFITDMNFEEIYEENNIEKHRYTCWLQFPYASIDSHGGFFSFHTEEEFEHYINHSIYQWTVSDVLNDQIEYEQYSEFLKMDINNIDKLKLKAIDLIINGGNK